MTQEIINTRKFVFRTIITTVLILLVLMVLLFFVSSKKAVLSAAVGSIIAAASFVVISIVVVTSILRTKVAGLVVFLGIAKMAAIGAVLWILITKGLVEPIGFLLGFSTLIVALVVENFGKAKWNNSQS